jgi:Na+/H+ antiporter NhaD/arsenite permease-like protein
MPNIAIESIAPLAAVTGAGTDLSLAWSIPFVALLACTALLPLLNKHFWERFYWAIAVGLGLITAVYYFAIARQPERWLHAMTEYASFIILLASLYIVSGGIYIGVNRRATPFANAVLLLIGAVIANVFGTTGASMLLIRPYLRMNAGHIKPFHVVFFIFIVANVGGALTPIGDPPLFLGYLYGVPFWWVLEHCRPMWMLAVSVLVIVFLALDIADQRKAWRTHERQPGGMVKIIGAHNFLFIALILYAVFQPGFFDVFRQISETGISARLFGRLVISRELLMLAAAVGSKWVTRDEPYHRNEFSYGAIKEVAILFVGIFSTMAPALQWLETNAHRMPVTRPAHFYFASGTLSSFLDNAPTYLTFLQIQLGEVDAQEMHAAEQELARMYTARTLDVRPDFEPAHARQAVAAMVRYHPDDVLSGRIDHEELAVAFLIGAPDLNLLLVAVSLGSVFFGACTYIGNGPNFMVKSIADAHGAATPSFTGYIIKYTLPVLVPTYVLVWWIFLRG